MNPDEAAGAVCEFTLLGTFRFSVDGVPLKIPIPRRAIALLAYVFLHGPTRVSRERLATNLWPDEIESDGRTKLRRMLYLIAQAAPESGSAEWLLTDATTIGWNPAKPRFVDVEALRDALAAPEPVDTSHLYAGDLLVDLGDEWLVPERDRLRTGHVTNLERLAKSHVAAARHAEARAVTLELLRLEPWREDAMRLALEMRVLGGDRAGALAEYERFEQRLRAELGVDPMPETIALRERLIREATPAEVRTAAPAARGPEAARSQPPAPEPVFVGRERELAMLAERFGEAERGRGGLVLVGGESGIGKTEFVTRHARTVTDRSGIVFTAGATFVATRPYQPFAAALGTAERMLASGEVTAPMQAALDRLVLGSVMRADGAGDAESIQDRKSLFESVVSIFEKIAETKPILLVLEDLHWAGSDTVAMLEYVARRASALPILVIATYRDGEVSRSHPLRAMRRRLQEEGLVANIALAPLQDREVQRYLEIVHGTASAATAERYGRASRGLPLVLAGLAADATAVPAGIPNLVPQREPATDKIPALAARLETLPPECRTLLEIAAVVGFGFDLELVVEVSGWSESEANRALSIALGRRVLREGPSGGYDFAHDLFREIVYDAMPPAKRARRHALVAEVLEQLHAGSEDVLAPELAMHYERAGDVERAIPALRRAATRALAAWALEDATDYATRALELGAAGCTAIQLRLIRESAWSSSGERGKQRDDLQACLEIVAESGDRGLEAEICYRRIVLEILASDWAAGEVAVGRLNEVAPIAGGTWPARAGYIRGTLYLEQDRYEEARVLFREADDLYAAAGDVEGMFTTALQLAHIARLTDDREGMESNLARCETHLATLGDRPELMIQIYELRQTAASGHQRLAEAAQWAQRGLDIALAIGSVSRIASAYMQCGAYVARLNQFEKASQYLSKSADMFAVIGDPTFVALNRYYQGALDDRLGNSAAGLAGVLGALEDFRELGAPFYIGVVLGGLARTHLFAGRFQEAETAAREAVEIWGRLHNGGMRAISLVHMAIAMCERGEVEAALPLLREACVACEQNHRPRDLADAWAARAFAAARLGATIEARSSAEHARALLAEFPETNRGLEFYPLIASAFRLIKDDGAARETIAEGARILRDQAASIAEPRWRTSFLSRPAIRPLLIDVGHGRKRANAP